MADEQGNAELEAYIHRLERLKTLAPDAAIRAAPAVLAALKTTAAAGQTPDGEAWDTKKDGSRALAKAADAITVATSGLTILLSLAGAYVYHNNSKGAHARRILPDSGKTLPSRVTEAIKSAAGEAFRRAMR